QLADEVTRKDLLVEPVHSRRSGNPTLLRGAEEVRSGGERQEQDDHVDERGQRKREHMAAAGIDEQLLESEHQVFLAADGAVDEVCVCWNSRTLGTPPVQRSFHVVPRQRTVDLSERAQLLLGWIERLDARAKGRQRAVPFLETPERLTRQFRVTIEGGV